MKTEALVEVDLERSTMFKADYGLIDWNKGEERRRNSQYYSIIVYDKLNSLTRVTLSSLLEYTTNVV